MRMGPKLGSMPLRHYRIPVGRGMGKGTRTPKKGQFTPIFRRRGVECFPSIPKIMVQIRKCSVPIEAPGAQSRKFATQTPPDSRG